jgi:type II secretory pathway component PulF
MAGRNLADALISFFDSTDPQQIRCSLTDLSRFTKQMAVLFGSGIPLHEALDSLTKVQSDKLSIFVIPELRTLIINGHRLSSALAKYPKVFPRTYVSLVRGAEETGELHYVLDKLAEWLENQDKIKRHVQKALTYPAFVIILACLLTLILFKTVIPQLLETVVGLGAELPLPTKILLSIVWMIEQPLFWIGLCLTVAGIAYYLRTPDGWRRFLIATRYVPVMGHILTSAGAARFSGTLAMLLKSGVDIIRACRIAADASGDPLLQADSERVLREIREGNFLYDVLSGRPYYPQLLVDLVEVGDESGQLAEVVGRASVMLEEETMHLIDMFMNLLEPIVLAGVSLIVGSILIAVLMPLSNLISAL